MLYFALIFGDWKRMLMADLMSMISLFVIYLWFLSLGPRWYILLSWVRKWWMEFSWFYVLEYQSMTRVKKNIFVIRSASWISIRGYIWGPFWHGLTLTSTWINYHMPNKGLDEITYLLPNLNCCTVDVWEWISNFISLFIMDVITCPYSD